jgi:hypothetical protein
MSSFKPGDIVTLSHYGKNYLGAQFSKESYTVEIIGDMLIVREQDHIVFLCDNDWNLCNKFEEEYI